MTDKPTIGGTAPVVNESVKALRSATAAEETRHGPRDILHAMRGLLSHWVLKLGGRLRIALGRPEVLLVTTFAGLILIGTVLLALPIAHRDQRVGLLDALFTATSAVCVTGLITVDTATAWSRFGQVVILALIQLGGLGIMTFGALAAQLFHMRISLTSQAAWQSTFFEQQTRGRLRHAVVGIVLLTLVIEAAGAGLLHTGLAQTGAARAGWFNAVFMAVSAYCNAGFAVYSDSLMGVRGSLLVLFTIMALIVAGGLGYAVMFELLGRGWAHLRRRRDYSVVWSLQARVVLRTSGVLIAGGAVLLLLTGLTAAERGWGERVLGALFQSVTARTAGFNTVNVGALPLGSLLILILLMFIGGSPGSCAGGVKTTTAAIWLARIRSRLRGRDAVTLLGREVPHDIVRRVGLLIGVAVLWNMGGVLLLALSEADNSPRLEGLIFEQVSAFATVGLSTGVTPLLSPLGKVWIIATMFLGRLGPLTIALAILRQPRTLYRCPVERVMVS